MPRFEFFQPTSVSAACKLLAAHGRKAAVLAGGTDLLVNLKRGKVKPGQVIGLGQIAALRGIKYSPQTGLAIGALATAARIAAAPEVVEHYPMLAEAASVLGSPLIRNLATAAGNLCTARPAADFPPALMALGARVELVSVAGKRELELDKFFAGVGKTRAKADEILTRILVPPPPPRSGGCYLKLGQRQTLEISLVNVGAWLALDASGRKIATARIVLGAVAPTPVRAKGAQKFLTGKPATAEVLAEAAAQAAAESKPIDDFRGSAVYRRLMVEVLTRRALEAALNRAGV